MPAPWVLGPKHVSIQNKEVCAALYVQAPGYHTFSGHIVCAGPLVTMPLVTALYVQAPQLPRCMCRPPSYRIVCAGPLVGIPLVTPLYVQALLLDAQ